ncbi:MAG: HD domain-containing protein, partial [Pseudomonadota bacterium]|nr:HD domain-containing protein [Pseudomonadota bacterium]
MTDLSTADSARIVAGFKAYYAGLALPEQAGNLYRLFVLKYAHSWKVARLCRVLAVGQGWDDGSVRAGTALGLLHDIARFAQLKVFGHFVDTQSIDHGRLGEAFLTGRLRTCEDVRKLAAVPLSDDKADLMLEDARVLSGFDFLGGMNNDTRAAVLAGIRLHNQRNPSLAEFGPNERMMIELIRDADKLDNMSMISNQMWHGNASLFSEMPYLTDRHEVRPEVTEQVQAGRLVGY